jgi:hypothetical protein
MSRSPDQIPFRLFVMYRLKAVPPLRRLVAGFTPRRPGFEPKSGHVVLVVEKVVGQVFSEYFGFPCQFWFHQLLHTHYLLFGAGTIGQLVADVPSGLSLTQPQETTKKRTKKPESYVPSISRPLKRWGRGVHKPCSMWKMCRAGFGHNSFTSGKSSV